MDKKSHQIRYSRSSRPMSIHRISIQWILLQTNRWYTHGQSPLRFLAEAVMQELEDQSLTNDTDIKLWDRFVDDAFSMMKTHHIENVFHTINNTTDGITFTMEKEKDEEIAFLDTKLT